MGSSRPPRIRAAALVLAQLSDELIQGGEAERAARVQAFLSKLSAVSSGAAHSDLESTAVTPFIQLRVNEATAEEILNLTKSVLRPEARQRVFGPELTPPAGASAVDRLAAFLGRPTSA